MWKTGPNLALRVSRRHHVERFRLRSQAVYPEGHHGNAVLSRYPIEHMRIVMFRSMVRKSAACSTADCAADDRESDSCDVRTSGPAEAHRQAQLAMLAEWVNELPEANRYW